MKQFIRFLVRYIPRPVLIKFSFLFSRIVQLFYKGNQVECTVCGKEFRKFLPYGNQGIDNRLCPHCLSLERHRLLWSYLKSETDFFTKPIKMLHIAPEQAFLKAFREAKNIDYTTADLESPIADVKMDVRQMPFDDAEFDVLFCNHVLEHIDDELKATSEIFRVLKPGGWAILQVPLDITKELTYEDPSITDRRERERIFGQYDHLRVYGRDYAKRIAQAGFVVDENLFVKTFSQQEIERYRFDADETIFVCKKER